MPTARAIPSSLRRSAASMTKIRKISRIPAAIENEPKVVKNDMNAAPAASAAQRVLLGVVGLEPERRSVGSQRLHDRSVCATPPRLATKTPSTRPGLPSRRCAGASGISRPSPAVAAPS